ncbi:conserved protein of unknown function (plasmid) [Rhodovastum atsumiense]|uniref:Phage late control D family protein n=1 Tax=Rhodovastum atsumiense TaxID=504468 RepID=A0A5M6INT7_9PROT|nr:contractile injection system protein, VgrG/Pvc8 family [Rhodovastum atsumiense]KAA5609647.1 hypothetical protein F1189_23070 [Rhodovastum atsumiense]CAH2606513.1 conserved protein of unknown function [Rhodovastum atsumiense]
MSGTNGPPAAGVRAPRLLILANGVELPGAVSADVEQNSAYQADSFRAEITLNAPGGQTAAWWADQPTLLLDIRVSIDGGNAWTSLIQGQVEHLSIHPDTGRIEVDGHDLSMRLVEAKTQEAFQNLTASQIAATLAARHDLKADVTVTTTPAGRYYELDHTHESLGQFSRVTTEWELLVWLAQKEGFDLYVTGETLHFHPATEIDTRNPYVVDYQPRAPGAPYPVSGVQDIRFERSLTLARDIEVVVQSWHAKQGKAFKKVAKAIGAKSAAAAKSATQVGTSTQRFVFVIPNLTEAQAQAEANKRLAELSKHEKNITWQGPGDVILSPRSIVDLRGTGAAFDQRYYVNTVSRRIEFTGGFGMWVTLKNHDTRSQAALT